MTHIRRLQLVLPNTLTTLRALHAEKQALPPDLMRCLQRGSVTPAQQDEVTSSLEPWQRSLLQTLPGDARSTGLAAAALCWCGEGGTLRPGTWMRIEPVHFIAGMNDVHIMSLNDISDQQLQQIMSVVQPLLSLSGYELHCSTAGRWYVWCEELLDIHTPLISDGLTMRDYAMLPTGNDAPALRRLLTEMQMLLHEHPVNSEREQQGLPAANAVWFSGAGSPTPAASSTRQRIMSDHPYVLGLCEQLNVSCWPLPRSAAELLRLRDDDMVMVLDGGDLSILGEQWLKSIMHSVCRGKISELQLFFDDLQLSFHGGRWQQLRRWFSSASSIQELLA